MNKFRRKALNELMELMEQLETIKDQLEEIQSEEEEYRDNMPENLMEANDTREPMRPFPTSRMP